ncbi:unnamed protein product [Rotaria sp. Silwood1]|nr:unnamed protein product [Rotaria sp. Silwood1]
MADKQKKFDACLIRTNDDNFIVAEWHQLVTTANKSKLTVGSCVGYKKSTNKREKIIRGTIMIIVCEKQKKLFMAKVNSKNGAAQKFDEKDECESESTGISYSKNDLESNDEDSSDSNDARLEIDTEQEENCHENNSKKIQSNQATINEPRNDNRSKTSDASSLNAAYTEEKTTSSFKRKSVDSDSEAQYVETKRKRISVSSYEELKMENNRMKKEIEKYKREWMPRPTDSSVIRYFVRMGLLFSSDGETEEGRGEKLIKICDQLNMTEEQLIRLQKPNGTRTARSIIRACYPLHTRVDALEEGIDDDIRQAVHDYVNMFHGMESLTDGKINESINNVFRSAKSQQKDDGKNESQQSTFNNSKFIGKKNPTSIKKMICQECEQLNEDLTQWAQTSTNFINESINIAASPDDQSHSYNDDCSLPNFTSPTMNESYEPQDKQNILSTSSDSLSRPIEKVDLAAALVALKNRHSLSAVCINDICSLLCVLNVPGAPRSWFQVKKALDKSCASSLDRTVWWICPNCKKTSDNKFTCSNANCNWRFAPPASMPNYFYTFNIRDQLSSTLATTADMYLPKCTNVTPHSILSMKDIVDSNYYRKLLDEESDDILTLTMSTDGIQPFKSTEKSIWPVTFIINEIKRKNRFSFQNLILGGVWPGPAKPKRFEMSAVLETIIVQLKELEKGSYFECRSDAGYVSRFLKVFLICACMDKPAQALVQNLPEPTAKFGCGRCEIRGYTVLSSENSDHRINCFPIENSLTQPHLRTNDRYDYLILIKELNDIEVEKLNRHSLDRKGKRQLKQKLIKNKESEHGILGPCVLRQLKYFDVGFSFVSDNLHNVYQGVTRKLLSLWLHADYKREDWSCYNHIHQLSSMLQSFRFPSTTGRRPRSLLKFKKFKASELRMVLLFGFVIFKKVLKAKYYDHFLKLVVAIHFSEHRTISMVMVDNVKSLLHEFLIEYPKLYTARHNQQVVHSLNHIGQTINDYGPLTSYSTFHFENILGIIMRTIKATRREEIEMIGSLNIFRRACLQLHDSTMNIQLKNYIENMMFGRGYYKSSSSAPRTMHSIPSNNRISTLFSNENLQFYGTIKIGRVRYTTADYSKSKAADDSAVLFRIQDAIHFGLITAIFIATGDEILLELWPLSDVKTLSIVTNGQKIYITSIQEGKLHKDNNYYYVPVNDIIEKCVYWKKKSSTVCFFRYPNLEESS